MCVYIFRPPPLLQRALTPFSVRSEKMLIALFPLCVRTSTAHLKPWPGCFSPSTAIWRLQRVCVKSLVCPPTPIFLLKCYFSVYLHSFPPHKFWKYLFRSFSDDAAGIKHKPKIRLSLTVSKLLTANVFFFIRWPVWRGYWPLSPWFWPLSAWLQVPSRWPRLQVGNSYIWGILEKHCVKVTASSPC